MNRRSQRSRRGERGRAGVVQCLNLCALCVLLFASLSHAQVSYQGRLDTQGTGLKAMSVSVYDAVTNGVSLWGPTSFTDVPVVDGFFNVVLPELDDSGTNSLAGIGSGSAFVEIIANGVTNGARQQILAVPRSLDGSPVGEITAFGGQTNKVPSGWLLCDGRAVSQTRYRALYDVVGDSWGPGDTNTTFNLPDLRGQFLRGVDLDADVDPDVGLRTNRVTTALQSGAGGYQGDAFKGHDHSEEGNVSTGLKAAYGASHNHTLWISGSRRTGIEGGNETRPKNAAVNFIIKY